MKVAIYARVSTDDKDQNPERQFLKCRQYCELHEHEVVEEIEDYYTGDSPLHERVGGKKMLDLDIDGIIVFSMDRLSRQHPIKVMRFIQEMKDRGIKIVSITEPAFNMENEFADFLIYIITWFNNYFLTKLKRDVKAGIERARAQGKQIGRAKAKFNKYRAYELLFEQNATQRQVAQEIGVSLSTINRFKKLCEKEGKYFIKDQEISLVSVKETPKEE